MPAILVFSPLRWDAEFRRARHLLSRLAKHYRVAFVEEPACREGEARIETSEPAPNVRVYRSFTPAAKAQAWHGERIAALGTLAARLAREYPDHIAWLYTPAALPLLRHIAPRLVVYDCTEERRLDGDTYVQERQGIPGEDTLLKAADIVFAGGPGLYRARQARHANVHCFPGSVDAAHFAQAADRGNSHPEHRRIAGPRLGFYGVIDERFDAALVAALADAHPRWQIVLAGPVERIAPSSLPCRQNIHYLGCRSYDELPRLLAGWDVCLLPFVQDESTRHLCPGQAIEYLAAGLPVVSTPLADVAELYGEGVRIAADAPAFVAACEAALLMGNEERAELAGLQRRLCALTSWDDTAARMHELLQAEWERSGEACEAEVPRTMAASAAARRAASA